MSWAGWVIARQRTSGIAAILLGTSLLMAWDLLLDPAMSKVTSYWVWGETGSYYGMPWSNLFGWGLTGLVLYFILYKAAPEPVGNLRFAVAVYAANYVLPLGFCMLNGYWIAVIAGIGGVLIGLSIFGWQRTANQSSMTGPVLDGDTRMSIKR
jgi:putative membrane protein